MPIGPPSGFSHFAIRVRDIESAKKFYGETLGWTMVRETKREEDTVINFVLGGTMFGIRGSHEATDGDDTFDPFRVGLDHLALPVTDEADLPKLVAQLDEAGVPHAGIQEEFGSKFVCFKDPDGITWELFFTPPWG